MLGKFLSIDSGPSRHGPSAGSPLQACVMALVLPLVLLPTPGIALVDSDTNATRSGDCVMAADFSGFPELTRTVSGPPGFLDADDLRATPEGNAVDHCDSGVIANTIDLLGLVRPVDHASGDVHGPYDPGAFEWRESYGLVFRDRFEVD